MHIENELTFLFIDLCVCKKEGRTKQNGGNHTGTDITAKL